MGALYFFAKVIGLESRKLPRSPPSIRTHAHNVHLEFLSDRVLQLILRSCSYVYPPKGRAKQTQWGQLYSLSILYVIEKPKLNFQKHERGSVFFETLKTLIVRMGG